MSTNEVNVITNPDDILLSLLEFTPVSMTRKPPIPLTVGRCDACNKIIEELETAIRGYATGEELGLCRKCASFVNTPQAVDFADSKGFTVHSKPIYSPAKASHDGGAGYEEGELD